jgi:hypothetical protein
MHIFARAMAWQLVPLTRSEEGLFSSLTTKTIIVVKK